MPGFKPQWLCHDGDEARRRRASAVVEDGSRGREQRERAKRRQQELTGRTMRWSVSSGASSVLRIERQRSPAAAMKMAVDSMEMASGGNSPSRQGARTETFVPRNLSSMAAALRNSSREKASVYRVILSGGICRRKGEGGGAPRAPPQVPARPGGEPRHPLRWAPRAPSPSPPRTSGTFRRF